MTGESADGSAAVRLERAERIRQTGPDIIPGNIEAMFGLYAQAHEQAGHRAPALVRDLQYGPDSRHRLDVHSSGQTAAEPAPVLIYVHGGGFAGGDKQIAGTPYYDTVGAWAVSHGMVGVTMTYRLAPQHQYPARSPMEGMVASGIPVMLAVAEIDPPLFHQQAATALQAFLRRDGTLPPFAWVAGHNHISEIAALGIDDESLGIPLLRFIESVTGTVLPRPAHQEPAPAA